MRLGTWAGTVVEALGLANAGNWSTIAAVVDLIEAAVYTDKSLRDEAQSNPHNIGPEAAGLVADIREWLAVSDPSRPVLPPCNELPGVTNCGDIVPDVQPEADDESAVDPSPEQIRAACRQIQSDWSEDDLDRRCPGRGRVEWHAPGASRYADVVDRETVTEFVRGRA